MRYLLAFYSGDTGHWRCLDTAVLSGGDSLRLEELPEALTAAGPLTLEWMQGPRRFEAVAAPETGLAEGEAGTAIQVYALGRDAALLGGTLLGHGGDYRGAWLEIFMAEHSPVGQLSAVRAGAVPVAAEAADSLALEALRRRAEDPLRAEAEACRQTMEQMRSQQEPQRGPSLPEHRPAAGIMAQS